VKGVPLVITEKDLQEAISECQGQKNPNANTCLKLAAFYTIREHMYGNQNKTDTPAVYPVPAYSYATGPNEYDSESEFYSIVRRKNMNDVLSVMDELMDTLNVINPRLYESVLAKLSY
jgi:hypothetical protein